MQWTFLLNLLSKFLFIIPKPFFYNLSNFIAWFMSNVVRYRKKVIQENLKNAFPQLSNKEIQKIQSQFYQNLTDFFLEMLLMASNSYDYIQKNYEIDLSELNRLYKEGKSVLMVLGHQFNWEWGLWILSRNTQFHVQGVYMPIKNKNLDAWLVNLRGKYGAEMVPANQVRTLLQPPTNKPTLTLIIGDQSPASSQNCIWTTFFHQETAFINAYEKIAQRRKMAVIFIEVLKKSRGKYHTPYQIFTHDASQLKNNELVQAFILFLEKSIQNQPANWLWSHKRWKHKKMN